MIQSRVIEIDGHFLGAAVAEACGWRFVATDLSVGGLHGTLCPSPDAARALAGALFRRYGAPGRVSSGSAASGP